MGTQRDPTFLQALARGLFATRHLSVLMVDPDVPGSHALAAALGRRHAVTVVDTIAAAYAAIERRIPTLVVTELDLPDGSGVTLLASLRARPETSGVLLMTLTQRASTRDKIAALQAGSDAYLVKPVDPRQFVRHVQRLSHFAHVLPRALP